MKQLRFVVVLAIILIFIVNNYFTASASSVNSDIDNKIIDDIVKEGMEKLRIPGLAIGIVKGDQLVYQQGYGVADDNGRLVTPQTPFILGSVSKSFTALAIMQLVEQGAINLDSPVQHYLKWFHLADPIESNKITIRHLLHHISGISTFEGSDIFSGDVMTLEEFVSNLSELELSEPIGTTFQYSNINYIILGQVIQSVSGLSYESYIDQYIFSPLDMQHSFATKSDAVKDGLATGYQPIFGIVTATNPTFRPSNVPAGYLMSSAEDMTHYLISQINNGTYQDTSILSSEGMRVTHQGNSVTSYGMGWFIDPFMISHAGDTENFHADIRMISSPEGWGIVTLYNTNDILSTSLLYGDMYGQIPNDILKEIQSSYILSSRNVNLPSTGMMHLYINIFVLMCIGLVSWSVYRLRKRKNNYNGVTIGFLVRLVFLLLFQFLLPVAFLWGLPRTFMSSWQTVVLVAPGIGHVLFILPIIIILVGLIKVILIVRMIRNHSFGMIVASGTPDK